MDDLNKLDFDVSYGTSFSQEKPSLIDVYEPKTETIEVDLPDDKFITFSANLIKCFRSKIKESSAKLRVDSLIDTYIYYFAYFREPLTKHNVKFSFSKRWS